ncbi:MAG: hypothetical protein JNK82_42390 [Myxococcaceae bacterium]|nr:hypothetical protein [Myxococcaceae bacterium]
MADLDLVALWKKTRDPRLGPLAAAARPKELEALVAEVRGLTAKAAAERVTKLTPVKDPLVEEALFRLLEQPQWRALTAAPFFKAAALALGASEGTRLAALGARYGDLIPTTVGVKYGRTLVRAGEAAQKVKWPSLDAEAAAVLQTHTKPAKKGRTLDELFAAVYAAPADDGPRRVLADALLEQNDLRGELIALQLAGRDPERVVKLLEKNAEKWLGPVAKAVLPQFAAFERGFVDSVGLFRSASLLPKALGHAEWATVRHVHLSVDRWADAKVRALLVELLTAPQMRALETVRWVRPDVLPALAEKKPGWRLLGVGAGSPSKVDLPACLARLPRLHTLDVDFAGSKATLRWVTDPKVAAKVSRLRVTSPGAHASAVWSRANDSGFAELELTAGYDPRNPDVHVAGERLVFTRGEKTRELDQLKVEMLPAPDYWADAAEDVARFRAGWQAGRRSATN